MLAHKSGKVFEIPKGIRVCEKEKDHFGWINFDLRSHLLSCVRKVYIFTVVLSIVHENICPQPSLYEAQKKMIVLF